MKRRDIIAGLGGLAVLGGGAKMARNVGERGGENAVEPVELETLDAPGSTSGTTTVPERGRVTVLELFATWCTVCQSMMPEMAAVHDAVGDNVQFLSVTNEPVGDTVTTEDVAAWWADHDGDWTVALDRDLELTQRLDANGVPYTFVFDENNRITWKHKGRSAAGEIESAVSEQLG
jgi:thiol-disulfide isomerase/thioredoxin